MEVRVVRSNGRELPVNQTPSLAFSHTLDYNGSASGQNQDAGPASHETRRLNGTTHRLIGNVTGVSMADIEAGLNANGAGLGDYSVEISVNVRTGGGAWQCVHEDNGENVDYVIELIALEYTVVEIKE